MNSLLFSEISIGDVFLFNKTRCVKLSQKTYLTNRMNVEETRFIPAFQVVGYSVALQPIEEDCTNTLN